MDREATRARSDLFVIRVWQEELGEGQTEWRGKVEHVLTGHSRYFREWSGLIEAIKKTLADLGRNVS